MALGGHLGALVGQLKGNLGCTWGALGGHLWKFYSILVTFKNSDGEVSCFVKFLKVCFFAKHQNQKYISKFYPHKW